MLTRTGLAVAAGAIVVGALGVRFGYSELVTASALAGGLLAVAWIAAHRKSAASVSRGPLPRRAVRGEPVPLRLTVANVGRSIIPPLWIADELDGRGAGALVDGLLPGEHAIVDIQLPAAARGLRRVGPIRVHRTDPFGLISAERSHGEVVELIVHPRVYTLTGSRGAGRFAEADLSRRRSASDPSAGFQSMREYVPGDDTRIIHWPSTAKVGKLMVREFVDPRRPTYTIVLLTNINDYRDADFEEAVDVAASLTAHVLSHDVDVVLRTTDPRQPGLATPIRGEREALDLLARVELTDELSSVPVARLVVSARQRSTVIAIGGPQGSSLGDLSGPLTADVRSIRIGSPVGAEAGRVTSFADAESFAVSWNDLTI